MLWGLTACAQTAAFSAEGDVRFEKEGYIEIDGTSHLQRDAMTRAEIKGDRLNASTSFLMMKKVYNPETASLMPGIMMDYSVSRISWNEENPVGLSYSFDVTFFDAAGKVIKRCGTSDCLLPDLGAYSTSENFNLSMSDISKITRYRVDFTESPREIES